MSRPSLQAPEGLARSWRIRTPVSLGLWLPVPGHKPRRLGHTLPADRFCAACTRLSVVKHPLPSLSSPEMGWAPWLACTSGSSDQ